MESDGTNIECAATNKIAVEDIAISFDAERDLLLSLNLGNIGSEEYDGAPESFAVDISPDCVQNSTELVHILVKNDIYQAPTPFNRQDGSHNHPVPNRHDGAPNHLQP
jgi:hypothetical protein